MGKTKDKESCPALSSLGNKYLEREKERESKVVDMYVNRELFLGCYLFI